jgi:FKBP-type peptidyl-prolyl cis-trans isomerase (trigger factor)
VANQNFKITKTEKLPDWEAQILGEIPWDYLSECRKEAIKHLKSHLNMPGFRPGQVPDDVVVKTVGESRILEEAAEVALGKEYQHIVEESKLRPIMRPQIMVTKMGPGIPLEFKVQLLLEPEFELPDYKKLAAEVTEEEGEKKRLKILENISKATELELPKKFVEAEVHHMLHHFQNDLEKAGIKWEPYLEQIKKTEEEVKKDWRESVETRAKNELILTKIAEKESLKTYREVFDLLEKKG